MLRISEELNINLLFIIISFIFGGIFLLLGDKMYGKKDDYKRVMLHCRHIGFVHPVYKYWVDFYANLPQDMKEIIGENDEII